MTGHNLKSRSLGQLCLQCGVLSRVCFFTRLFARPFLPLINLLLLSLRSVVFLSFFLPLLSVFSCFCILLFFSFGNSFIQLSRYSLIVLCLFVFLSLLRRSFSCRCFIHSVSQFSRSTLFFLSFCLQSIFM